ncbi:hypothetical protein H5410_009227 [Solanum commersonii]|uniref:Uncharacterized protein n=1 Tax=Solanum commersonii TaxID=4109 RepID=A0A9J6AHU5_SOLCO|nr:hypothetical protein H5410_009227 [Solanum commersonii]
MAESELYKVNGSGRTTIRHLVEPTMRGSPHYLRELYGGWRAKEEVEFKTTKWAKITVKNDGRNAREESGSGKLGEEDKAFARLMTLHEGDEARIQSQYKHKTLLGILVQLGTWALWLTAWNVSAVGHMRAAYCAFK